MLFYFSFLFNYALMQQDLKNEHHLAFKYHNILFLNNIVFFSRGNYKLNSMYKVFVSVLCHGTIGDYVTFYNSTLSTVTTGSALLGNIILFHCHLLCHSRLLNTVNYRLH